MLVAAPTEALSLIFGMLRHHNEAAMCLSTSAAPPRIHRRSRALHGSRHGFIEEAGRCTARAAHNIDVEESSRDGARGVGEVRGGKQRSSSTACLSTAGFVCTPFYLLSL